MMLSSAPMQFIRLAFSATQCRYQPLHGGPEHGLLHLRHSWSLFLRKRNARVDTRRLQLNVYSSAYEIHKQGFEYCYFECSTNFNISNKQIVEHTLLVFYIYLY